MARQSLILVLMERLKVWAHRQRSSRRGRGQVSTREATSDFSL